MKGFVVNLLFLIAGSLIMVLTFDISFNFINWLLYVTALVLINLGGHYSTKINSEWD